MPVTLFAAALFWSAAALILYTYCGYPLLLWLVAGRGRRPEPPDLDPAALPFLSVLVAVYNEEAVIDAKLDNCAAFDYPSDRIEFLFGSDGSDDRTEAIFRARPAPNFQLTNFPGRRGKSAVLNDLAPKARGEILVFTDANTMFEPSAARRLARHFQDPQVGGVCGLLKLRRPSSAPGRWVADEASYWQFETLIKRLEGRLGLLAAANGAIYAIRCSFFRPLPTHPPVSEDMLLPCWVLAQNARVTFEAQAMAYESAPSNTRSEFRRKTRVAEFSYNLVPYLLPLLAPWRGRVSWTLWSHKILRWMVPFLLLAMLAASVVLWPIPFYRFCLLLQLGVYVGALVGYWFDARQKLPAWLSPPYYFVGGNLAMLIGFFRSLLRSTNGPWVRVGR